MLIRLSSRQGLTKGTNQQEILREAAPTGCMGLGPPIWSGSVGRRSETSTMLRESSRTPSGPIPPQVGNVHECPDRSRLVCHSVPAVAEEDGNRMLNVTLRQDGQSNPHLVPDHPTQSRHREQSFPSSSRKILHADKHRFGWLPSLLGPFSARAPWKATMGNSYPEHPWLGNHRNHSRRCSYRSRRPSEDALRYFFTVLSCRLAILSTDVTYLKGLSSRIWVVLQIRVLFLDPHYSTASLKKGPYKGS